MHVHFCVNINNLTKKWYEGPNANALKMSLYVSYQKPKKLSALNTLSLSLSYIITQLSHTKTSQVMWGLKRKGCEQSTSQIHGQLN
jgi:hypothetical protein